MASEVVVHHTADPHEEEDIDIAAHQVATAIRRTPMRRSFEQNDGEVDELELIENAMREAGITASQRRAAARFSSHSISGYGNDSHWLKAQIEIPLAQVIQAHNTGQARCQQKIPRGRPQKNDWPHTAPAACRQGLSYNRSGQRVLSEKV